MERRYNYGIMWLFDVHILDMEKYPLNASHIPFGCASRDISDIEEIIYHIPDMIHR